MNQPSISIVTPCLNAEATIEETLASVRNQHYPALEHIFVDGGSTDGTLDILRAADNVRFISEPDRGLSDAFNKGVAMAQNEVIGWLNADDIYLPGALETVGSALAANPEALWATGRCVITGSDGEEIRSAVSSYKNFLLKRFSLRLFLTHNFVASPATFVRREAFEIVGGALDERFKYSADYDLWLRLARKSNPVVIDADLACFRMADSSLSMTGFETQFAEHAQNARENGAGHRVAVGVNQLISKAIVLTYRAMRAVRIRRRAPNGQA